MSTDGFDFDFFRATRGLRLAELALLAEEHRRRHHEVLVASPRDLAIGYGMSAGRLYLTPGPIFADPSPPLDLELLARYGSKHETALLSVLRDPLLPLIKDYTTSWHGWSGTREGGRHRGGRETKADRRRRARAERRRQARHRARSR